MGKRKGFTFVEVSLFLAVTAALFIGIALGMQNSIFQQRYNDTTQNFFEFMRSVYSKVSNPQSAGYGNSETEAIYGKLVVFGEKVGILGENLYDTNGQPLDGRPIFMYDVVGDVIEMDSAVSGSVTKLLEDLNANVVRVIKSGDDTTHAELVSPEKYEMRWQMSLQNIDGDTFTGAILVVRHPRSGTINTLVSDEVIDVNEKTAMFNEKIEKVDIENLLKQYLSDNKFDVREVDFCVSPYEPHETGMFLRRDIRIMKNARNASSVQLVDQDDLSENGNRCVK